jgi:hypothetical protein
VIPLHPVELDGGLGTLARLLINPAPASSGTRLHVQVAAALDGRDADSNLDPALSLADLRIGDVSRNVKGLSEILTLEHSEPVEVDLVVRRGSETTVLFDIDAERI